MSFTIYR